MLSRKFARSSIAISGPIALALCMASPMFAQIIRSPSVNPGGSYRQQNGTTTGSSGKSTTGVQSTTGTTSRNPAASSVRQSRPRPSAGMNTGNMTGKNSFGKANAGANRNGLGTGGQPGRSSQTGATEHSHPQTGSPAPSESGASTNNNPGPPTR